MFLNHWKWLRIVLEASIYYKFQKNTYSAPHTPSCLDVFAYNSISFSYAPESYIYKLCFTLNTLILLCFVTRYSWIILFYYIIHMNHNVYFISISQTVFYHICLISCTVHIIFNYIVLLLYILDLCMHYICTVMLTSCPHFMGVK